MGKIQYLIIINLIIIINLYAQNDSLQYKVLVNSKEIDSIEMIAGVTSCTVTVLGKRINDNDWQILSASYRFIGSMASLPPPPQEVMQYIFEVTSSCQKDYLIIRRLEFIDTLVINTYEANCSQLNIRKVNNQNGKINLEKMNQIGLNGRKIIHVRMNETKFGF